MVTFKIENRETKTFTARRIGACTRILVYVFMSTTRIAYATT